jgi:hypothetical protein
MVTATKSDITSENITTTDKHDAGGTGEEEQRHEHRDVRQRRGQDGRPHFFAAVDGRRHPVLPHVQVPVGVLEHDDRRVDDHADAEGETAKVMVFSVKPPK